MKLKNGSQVATRPSRVPTVGSPGYFSESNETGAPSHPGQDWFNDVIDELTQAVAAAGVTYDPSKITNLKSAVEALRNASNLNAGTVPLVRLPAGTSGGIDAAKLEGQNGAYYRNIANMTGNVPIERLPTTNSPKDTTLDKVTRVGYAGMGVLGIESGVDTGIPAFTSGVGCRFIANPSGVPPLYSGTGAYIVELGTVGSSITAQLMVPNTGNRMVAYRQSTSHNWINIFDSYNAATGTEITAGTVFNKGIAPLGLYASGYGFTVGQVRTSMSLGADRAQAVDYINTDIVAREVTIVALHEANNTAILSVGGKSETVGSTGGTTSFRARYTFIVLPGEEYSIVGASSIMSWTEVKRP